MKVRFFIAIKWLCLISGLCLAYGFLIEPKQLVTRDVEIESPHWKAEPIRIALLSDLHIGGLHVTGARAYSVANRVRNLKPDLVLIPGDFVAGHTPRVEHDVRFNHQVDLGLKSLWPMRPDKGVFATIGNHDVWYGEVYVTQRLEDNDITVLKNEARMVDGNICIVGLADHDTQTEDAGAFQSCVEGSSIIALMHSPDSFQYLRSDTALALAGHTHGGQINLPLLGRAITATRAGKKYAYGKIDANGIPAFVTAGIGTSILPARFRAPPEIVIITLRGAY